jgi:hypothetical protein
MLARSKMKFTEQEDELDTIGALTRDIPKGNKKSSTPSKKASKKSSKVSKPSKRSKTSKTSKTNLIVSTEEESDESESNEGTFYDAVEGEGLQYDNRIEDQSEKSSEENSIKKPHTSHIMNRKAIDEQDLGPDFLDQIHPDSKLLYFRMKSLMVSIVHDMEKRIKDKKPYWFTKMRYATSIILHFT